MAASSSGKSDATPGGELPAPGFAHVASNALQMPGPWAIKSGADKHLARKNRAP
jgi:hypothetical protein